MLNIRNNMLDKRIVLWLFLCQKNLILMDSFFSTSRFLRVVVAPAGHFENSFFLKFSKNGKSKKIKVYNI